MKHASRAATGLVGLLRSPFSEDLRDERQSQRKDHRRARWLSYLVVSQPRYRPTGDTLRLKARVLRRGSGRPATQPLTLWLSGGGLGRRKRLATLRPVRPGLYEYSLPLTDTLGLRVGTHADLYLEDSHERPAAEGSFQLEDYELKSNHYALRRLAKEPWRGQPQVVFMRGSDANELNLPAARAAGGAARRRAGAAAHAPAFRARHALDPRPGAATRPRCARAWPCAPWTTARSGGLWLAGPFRPDSILLRYREDGQWRKFLFEPLYAYKFSPGVVKMTCLDPSQLGPLNGAGLPRPLLLGDFAYTERDFGHGPFQTAARYRDPVRGQRALVPLLSYPHQTPAGQGRLELRCLLPPARQPDRLPAPLYTLLTRPDRPKFRRLRPGLGVLHALPPATTARPCCWPTAAAWPRAS